MKTVLSIIIALSVAWLFIGGGLFFALAADAQTLDPANVTDANVLDKSALVLLTPLDNYQGRRSFGGKSCLIELERIT